LQDGTIFGEGLVHQAFLLDGNGDFVDVTHDPGLNLGTGDFSIVLWIYFNDTSGEQVLIEKWIQRFPGSTGWSLIKLENNNLRLAMADGDGTETNVDTGVLSIPTDTWTQFAVTRKGSIITLFMDGVPVARDSSHINLDSEASLKLGHRGNPSDTPGSEDDRGFFLNGRIDEVALFVGRALHRGIIRSIFKAGSAGMCKEWDGLHVQKPSVLHDTSDYKIWYDGAIIDGNAQVGLARSKDGVSWKKFPRNPVLIGSPDTWDASGEHAPFVMKDGDLYKMWYEGSDGNVRQLGYATSRNGITWRKYPGNPVLQAGPEHYDQFVAGHGTVLYEDGLYKLWYHAIGDLDGIGDLDATIAYATSQDGIHWNKQGPVLIGAPDSWDTGLWGPSVLKVNGVYWMWYSAGGPVYPISIGAATSPDGIEWTRVGDAPVITDSEFVNNFSDPHVIFEGGLFKMWIGNFSDDAIYYAESENGIDWSEPVPSLLPGASK
jgi:predicted GH43/DUF377 family glycosyl hydrolase